MQPTATTPKSESAAPIDTATAAGQARAGRISVLLEMRPALEGFAGIPQETRLLFRGLRMIDSVRVEGMIQASIRILARGIPLEKRWRMRKLTEARKINRYSRVIVSLAEGPFRAPFARFVQGILNSFSTAALTLRTMVGLRTVRLSRFETEYFRDFVWRTVFAKTLPAADFDLVTSANQRICSVPWKTMHMAGLYSLTSSSSPIYPRLETKGIDVFIAQTPYPARISRDTAFVVRYHDALPVFMPHTIPEKSTHQATHFYALMDNVKAGAWFACVSEATRQDLLKLFPEAAPHAVTIHNMVSHHYFAEEPAPLRVPLIIRARLYQHESLVPKLRLRDKEAFYQRHLAPEKLRYLLIVSTIEPRKNHLRLLAAWEVIKAETDPDLKLVVVGTLGWDNDAVTRGFKSWIERGQLFSLNEVPSADLRILYRNAAATVCPSLGEGFDFSGVEAMASDGVVISSDIPVHREVYCDASEYFDPYSTSSLAGAIRNVLYGADAQQRQEILRARGREISRRYLPENILPKWDAFLQRVVVEQRRVNGVPATAGRPEAQAHIPST